MPRIIQQPSKHELIRLGQVIINKTNELVPDSSNKKHDSQPLSALLIMAIRYGNKRVRAQILNLKSTLSFYTKNKQDNFALTIGNKKFNTLSSIKKALVSDPNMRCKPSSKWSELSDIQKLNRIEKSAIKATQFRVGNCGEKSNTAFVLLRELNRIFLLRHEFLNPYIFFKIKIELCYSTKGDHVFVVLNRPDNSDINNLKTWGADAVIVDPWGNCVFDVSRELAENNSQLFKYIKDNGVDIKYTSRTHLFHSNNWQRKYSSFFLGNLSSSEEQPALNFMPPYEKSEDKSTSVSPP